MVFAHSGEMDFIRYKYSKCTEFLMPQNSAEKAGKHGFDKNMYDVSVGIITGLSKTVSLFTKTKISFKKEFFFFLDKGTIIV